MHFKEKGSGANNQNIRKLINTAASFALADKEVSIPENGEVSSYRTLHRFLFFINRLPVTVCHIVAVYSVHQTAFRCTVANSDTFPKKTYIIKPII